MSEIEQLKERIAQLESFVRRLAQEDPVYPYLDLWVKEAKALLAKDTKK